MPKETRRDASKLETGSRRRHNARKIAIGGARLDSRLRDFRSATKSAENRERALNGRVSVFVFCPPPPSPRTPLPPPCKRGGEGVCLRFSLPPGKGKHSATNGFIQALGCPLFTPFFCTLYVYYIRWRAPPFFVSHKGQTMTAARCVSSLMFHPSHPSSLLPSQGLRKFNAIPFAHFLYLSPSLSHLLFFFLHHLTFNYTLDVIYFYIYYNIYLTDLFTF